MTTVRIEPWVDDDIDLLRQTNEPAMTEFLGGPEPEEKVLDRHQRYLALRPPAGQMYHVLAQPERAKAGTVGFWEREWRGVTVYEIGWGVLPEFQGRGIARAAAVAALREAAALGHHRYVHAYPKVEHAASNRVCAGAGFTLLGASDFEYPPGTAIRCNDWRFDLRDLVNGR